MAAAKWSLTVTRRAIDAAGAAHLEADLLDNNVKQGALVLTLTADRALTVVWVTEPGARGLSGFQAWEKA